MMKTFLVPLFLLSTILYMGCAEKIDERPEKKPGISLGIFKSSEKIFGFDNQARYSYCPSIVKQSDGTTHMFFCGNPQENIMVDNIYHVQINADGTQTSAKSVLKPGSGNVWDSQHACDPSVIEGDFVMNGTHYKYAMFYLGCTITYYYNEVGVAFSNDLAANSWVKYPNQIVGKSWSNEGEQTLPSGGKSWGVGQPSAISLDGAGKVLLTFTIGDVGGTRIEWAELDMADMNNFTAIKGGRKVLTNGLRRVDNSAGDYLCNADFAIDAKNDLMVMVRPVQPHPATYPAYLPVAQELCSISMTDFRSGAGTWRAISRITSATSGFARNHNAALEREPSGELSTQWNSSVVYFTVSKAAPDVSSGTRTHAEWSYHIYKTQLKNGQK